MEKEMSFVNVSSSNKIQDQSFYVKGSSKIKLPDFNDVTFFTKKKTGTSDSEYTKSIVEQAVKDQKAGKFQNDSQGFNQLMKRYVSEVSPDRKGIITRGLQAIEKDTVPVTKPLDVVALLLDGEVKYQKDINTVDYAEFYDGNGELVATYSNNGWTMFSTKAESGRQIEMCTIYTKAWNAAQKAAQDSSSVTAVAPDSGYSENTFDMRT